MSATYGIPAHKVFLKPLPLKTLKEIELTTNIMLDGKKCPICGENITVTMEGENDCGRYDLYVRHKSKICNTMIYFSGYTIHIEDEDNIPIAAERISKFMIEKLTEESEKK